MTEYIIYCKNCGVKYIWQGSGQWNQSYPSIYNDREYCPECKKAILEALAKIEKKSVVTWIPTDLVDLNTILRWNKENDMEDIIKRKESDPNNPFLSFPKIMRVFSSLYNSENGKSSRTIQVNGRDEHKDKIFICSFWQDPIEPINITVFARVDMDGNIIKYEKEK